MIGPQGPFLHPTPELPQLVQWFFINSECGELHFPITGPRRVETRVPAKVEEAQNGKTRDNHVCSDPDTFGF